GPEAGGRGPGPHRAAGGSRRGPASGRGQLRLRGHLAGPLQRGRPGPDAGRGQTGAQAGGALPALRARAGRRSEATALAAPPDPPSPAPLRRLSPRPPHRARPARGRLRLREPRIFLSRRRPALFRLLYPGYSGETLGGALERRRSYPPINV